MKVKFIPINKEVEIKAGQSVLNVAQDHDIHIQSVCKGIPSCAECRVQVVEGSENLLPPMDEELDLIGTAHFVDHSRLSCQMRCFGSVTVDLSEQMEKENESSKQPQGRASKKEGEESFARMGNILVEPGSADAATEDDDEIVVTKEDKSKRKPLRAHADNNNQKKSSGSKNKNKNKNRNRNRNRNKNKNTDVKKD